MDLIEWLTGVFKSIADAIFNVLPKSPIVYLETNSEIRTILSYINWFIPVYLWISILESWLVSILTYYIVQIVLRWIKVIE